MTATHPPTSSLLHSLQIVFVRGIVSLYESQTNVVTKMDDRTCPLVDVNEWLDDKELEVELNLRAECR